MIATETRSSVRLTERATADPRIDESTHTLRDVTLLGRRSKNGRIYSQKALADVGRLAEDAQVFADHSARQRSVNDLVGTLRNSRVEGGRVKADLLVLSESKWPLIRNTALRSPRSFGFSIDARGEFGPDKRTVARVLELNSVDLVTRPATTAGLFESEQWREEELAALKRRWNAGGQAGVIEHRPGVARATDVSTADNPADAELVERWKAGDGVA